MRPGGGGLGGSSGSGPGAAVGGVLSGYPAAQAGLTQGDAITSFGGRAVGSTEALRAMLSAHHPGDVVRLAWTDTAGGTHTATVTLAAGPAL